MFKVGTICIGQNFVNCPQNNGMECEIIEGLKMVSGDNEIGLLAQGLAYKVLWADGEVCWVGQRNLRPKHYPGSWEDEPFQEVLKELGWNPLTEVIK